MFVVYPAATVCAAVALSDTLQALHHRLAPPQVPLPPSPGLRSRLPRPRAAPGPHASPAPNACRPQ
jgi:hypothetical protein